jgi:DNA-binding CsgD family transcriptional regulator
VRIRKRRIVERPRLYALLDESKARVRMLVAPAGYGKTTLAEQWVARDGRVAAWFTARSSSTDVAALALGIARSATSLVEGCDHRLREHLRALPAPAENVDTLAEILGEDLAAWPSNGWLVIDDYHEIAQEPRAEDFIAALVQVSSIQFLIATRVRPSWISTKGLLYGEALELSQTSLAMDNREAADVLVDRSGASASGLVSLANGWPAVIGLASVSSAEVDADAEPVPESLYNFFAEEVFSSLDGGVQRGLTTLSVAPVLDRELAGTLLGDAAEAVLANALDVGILAERDSRLDLHPLARAFLGEKSDQMGLVPVEGAGEVCLAHYRERRDWDAAFDLIVRQGSAEELEALLSAAIDELLGSARLSTLERWCEFAFDADLRAPIFSVARAEVLLRHGRHLEAIAHAESAAGPEGEHVFRALSVAGRAAHLASREDDALELYRRAYAAACTDADQQDALWGELGCLIDLEDPEAKSALARLSDGVSFGQPRELVRAAAHRLALEIRFGSNDLDDADIAYSVLPAVTDPIVRSSFLNGYAFGLSAAARYEEASRVSNELAEAAQHFRLTFVLPYALCSSAMAHSGQREWKVAEAQACEALSLARKARDSHVEQISSSLLLRIYAQQGQFSSALDLRIAEPRGGLKASRAELVCSLALVLACADRTAEALHLVDRVRGTTTGLEAAVLTTSVDAICALRSGSSDVVERVAALTETAFDSCGMDFLVASYRACPELIGLLVRCPRMAEVQDLLVRIGDTDIAAAAGHPVATGVDRRALLTPRELDVYELLCSGLTNRQIARALFIEESTAKVHVHHIYDKLGVRSRKALAVHALLERSDQATATIRESSDSE